MHGNKIWEKNFSSLKWGEYPSEESIRFYKYVKKKIKKNNPEALDIGCGIGSCAWFLIKEGSNLTVIDGSKSALSKLKITLRKFKISKKKYPKVIFGNILFPKIFINKKFTIILDHYSIYSNPDKFFEKTYKDYFDLLKKGGYFLTCMFGKRSTAYKKGKKISKNTVNIKVGKLKTGGIQTFVEKIFIMKMMKKIGFKIKFYNNILENHDKEIVEKHIFCLKK